MFRDVDDFSGVGLLRKGFRGHEGAWNALIKELIMSKCLTDIDLDLKTMVLFSLRRVLGRVGRPKTISKRG